MQLLSPGRCEKRPFADDFEAPFYSELKEPVVPELRKAEAFDFAFDVSNCFEHVHQTFR